MDRKAQIPEFVLTDLRNHTVCDNMKIKQVSVHVTHIVEDNRLSAAIFKCVDHMADFYFFMQSR